MNVKWFKEKLAPLLEGFEIVYKYFEEGDFGSLNQIEFNSDLKGGEIDFWSSGFLGIHLVDYLNSNELLNEFLEPNQIDEKQIALLRLEELLSNGASV